MSTSASKITLTSVLTKVIVHQSSQLYCLIDPNLAILSKFMPLLRPPTQISPEACLYWFSGKQFDYIQLCLRSDFCLQNTQETTHKIRPCF